jgi:hypothetical protein
MPWCQGRVSVRSGLGTGATEPFSASLRVTVRQWSVIDSSRFVNDPSMGEHISETEGLSCQ